MKDSKEEKEGKEERKKMSIRIERKGRKTEGRKEG